MSRIKNTFNDIAGIYDNQRKKLIPCFDDLYNSAVSVIQLDVENPRVLDIGAGTGLFSSFILKKYPGVELTLIDISENMLDVARARFAHNTGVKYIVDDYAKHVFEEDFDAVISALSIHHLADNEKRYYICKPVDLDQLFSLMLVWLYK